MIRSTVCPQKDGRFDKADRLFQSLPDAYASCTRNPGDVKEAIPELYFLPELLVNANGLDLGCPQSTGMPLSDVELPPWAHGDPWEFVRRHREALESEHVSLRLHAWIDLVFGCRQRPPALNRGRRGAVESCNVFFHLTYPGAVDLPRLREQDPQVSLGAINWRRSGKTYAPLGVSACHCEIVLLALAMCCGVFSSMPLTGASSLCVSHFGCAGRHQVFQISQVIVVHGCALGQS